MGSYTQKSPPSSSTLSNISPSPNSSTRSYNQECVPQAQKDTFHTQAANHRSPNSSYSSSSSKLGLPPSCQSMEPHGSNNQRSLHIGGQGGSQASSYSAPTPTRGAREPHVQSSPANPPATSTSGSSSSVPYSHFQPHPGLGHQGGPPLPPHPRLASSNSVSQQQQRGPHEAWRYQNRTSSHSLVSPTSLFTNCLCSETLLIFVKESIFLNKMKRLKYVK